MKLLTYIPMNVDELVLPGGKNSNPQHHTQASPGLTFGDLERIAVETSISYRIPGIATPDVQSASLAS
jgi:hypothetical protein